MQDIIEGSEGHELGDDNKIRWLVARSEHREDVRMIEDPTIRGKHAGFLLYAERGRIW